MKNMIPKSKPSRGGIVSSPKDETNCYSGDDTSYKLNGYAKKWGISYQLTPHGNIDAKSSILRLAI